MENLDATCSSNDSGYCIVVAAMKRMEAVVRKLAPYMQHRGRCHAFPATSEEQVRRNCDCGLSEKKSGISALLNSGQAMHDWSDASGYAEDWDALKAKWNAALEKLEKP